MFNFQKLYEWIFKSFRIKRSSSLVETFEQENIRHLMIIRRSWIYGILINLLLLLVVVMTAINVLFILENFSSNSIIGYIIVAFVIFSITLTTYSGLVYLFYFHAIHGKANDILDIYECERVLSKGGVVFTRFFNRVTLSYFLCIFVILFELYYLIFVSRNYFSMVPYLDIASLLAQTTLIGYYRSRMIDLEMDYILVVPGKIYFIDQVGVHANIQTLQLMSNIKTIQSRYPNFLGSFFDFGTIEIILDTMNPNQLNTARSLHMHYVTSPLETVNMINKLLVDYNKIPLVMDTILREIGLSGQNPESPEVADGISRYLVEYEEHMKKLFTEANPQEKNEIMRIYKRYIPQHVGF